MERKKSALEPKGKKTKENDFLMFSVIVENIKKNQI